MLPSPRHGLLGIIPTTCWTSTVVTLLYTSARQSALIRQRRRGKWKRDELQLESYHLHLNRPLSQRSIHIRNASHGHCRPLFRLPAALISRIFGRNGYTPLRFPRLIIRQRPDGEQESDGVAHRKGAGVTEHLLFHLNTRLWQLGNSS